MLHLSLLVEEKDPSRPGYLEMLDLLENLGRYIICQESSNVGERNRLWKSVDIKKVLKNNKVSALFLKYHILVKWCKVLNFLYLPIIPTLLF